MKKSNTMKNKIWIIVIVVVIVVLGGVSGALTGIALNDFADSINKAVEQPYLDEDMISMLDKMGISNDYLSGYGTLQEAIKNINKPIKVHNVAFSSDEITALLNISPEFLESSYLKSVSFSIQPDNSVNLDAYIDVLALGEDSGIPNIALALIQNAKLSANARILGVSEDNKLIVKVDEVLIQDMSVKNFVSYFPLGDELKSLVSEMTDKEIYVDFSQFAQLKSFKILDNKAYIDGTFDFSGNASD